MRYVKILLALSLIFVATYFVSQNSQTVSVKILPGWEVKEISIGLLLVIVSIIAISLSAIIAGYFGIKNYFREQYLLRQDRVRQAGLNAVLEAKSLQAAGLLSDAEAAWKKLLKKDSHNLLARPELARSIKLRGEYLEALKVLDVARSESSSNAEVLFEAAEINLKLKNKTAAIDNLALVIAHHQSSKAALLASELSEQLERYEDALEYHKKAIEFGAVENHKLITARLELKNVTATKQGSELKSELLRFLKLHPDFPQALELLAETELALGKPLEAAEYYAKLARATDDSTAWIKAAQTWITNNEPEKAISAVKLACKDESDKSKLCLVRVYLLVNRVTDAKAVLETIKEESEEALKLKALVTALSGDNSKTVSILEMLVGTKDYVTLKPKSSLTSANQPSPILSTP